MIKDLLNKISGLFRKRQEIIKKTEEDFKNLQKVDEEIKRDEAELYELEQRTAPAAKPRATKTVSVKINSGTRKRKIPLKVKEPTKAEISEAKKVVSKRKVKTK